MGTAGATGQQGTVGPTGSSSDTEVEYGVGKVWLNDGATDAKVATLWSSNVPDDGNNAAQSSGTIVVQDINTGDEIFVTAAVRTDGDTGPNAADAGGFMTAASFDGQIIRADQTPAGGPGGTNTEAVSGYPLTSGDPTVTDP